MIEGIAIKRKAGIQIWKKIALNVQSQFYQATYIIIIITGCLPCDTVKMGFSLILQLCL